MRFCCGEVAEVVYARVCTAVVAVDIVLVVIVAGVYHSGDLNRGAHGVRGTASMLAASVSFAICVA